MWKIFKNKEKAERKREKTASVFLQSEKIINKIDVLVSKGHLVEKVYTCWGSGYKIDRISICYVDFMRKIKIDDEYLESQYIEYKSVTNAYEHLYKIYENQNQKNNIEGWGVKEKRLEDERIKKFKDYLND